jgi:hypothetical protein
VSTSAITRAELDAALDDVLAAPKTDAPLETLCLRPALNKRQMVEAISFTRAEAIAGDRWLSMPWLRTEEGAPHPGIQVSILPSRVMDLVWRDREATPHPGDPIVADLDTSEANLPVGTLILAGTAVLRVSEVPNLGCVKWKVRYGTDALRWVESHPELRLRGVLCSVEQDGEITLNDRLQVLR